MITKQELIQAYGDWIIQEVQDGRMVHYINLMFDQLKGGSNAIITQMHSVIENVFYPELCGQLDRHPRRQGRHLFSPHVVLVPDLPTFKYTPNTTRPVTLNKGLHYNGLISISPRSRLRGNSLMNHFAHYRQLFARLGFREIHAVAITNDPHELMDYSMKTIKQGRATFDNAIILPRSWNERQRTPLQLSAKDRAIKQIASSTNVSAEVASQLYEGNSSK